MAVSKYGRIERLPKMPQRLGAVPPSCVSNGISIIWQSGKLNEFECELELEISHDRWKFLTWTARRI